MLYKDGRVNVLTNVKGMKPNPSLASWIIGERSRRCVETDVLEWCLFTLPVSLHREPPYPIYSLWEALHKGKVTVARWETLGRTKMAHLRIEMVPAQRSYDLWIDPAVNWLLRKCIHEIHEKDGTLRWHIEHSVEDFLEARNTIFIPIRTRCVSRYMGDLALEEVARLRNVRVNESLPPIPRWPVPPEGVRILDEVRGTTYMVDKSANRVGRESRVGSEYSPPMPGPDPSIEVSYGRVWVGIIFLAVACILVGVGSYRLRRRANLKSGIEPMR